ncbi:hypothetical protein ACIRPT_32060 [Streptomyces sp. NPDC101227]|uniref:hypothetical protein n=1 Tax=Streptomyces sp. NPDC101227 TaxID=3366136 RepID=UPI0038276CCA
MTDGLIPTTPDDAFVMPMAGNQRFMAGAPAHLTSTPPRTHPAPLDLLLDRSHALAGRVAAGRTEVVGTSCQLVDTSVQ